VQRLHDGVETAGVGYASAGLVWAAHGEAYVQALANGYALDAQAVADTARCIEHSLVKYLDIMDTGHGDVAPGHDIFSKR
jgi:uncharacterized UPF0160 family protein